MEVIHLDRNKTFFHNSFLEDYYNSSKFDNLRTYKPSFEHIDAAIEEKKGFKVNKYIWTF